MIDGGQLIWAGLAASAGLVALWVAAVRRHARTGRAGDWRGASTRPDLWTSSVPCPRCQRGGGVLAEDAGELWHRCLSCGHRHRRATKS